jgi:Tol biopolymer transport system component
MLLGGFAWLPDGSGILYSSARGSTVFYLPTMNLWVTKLKGDTQARKLTYGEASYEDPDVDRTGRIFASRMHRHFDIWKVPLGGTPSRNVREAVQITHQTGQVQTPTVAPTDQEIAFLSDTGGHGNIWILKLKTGNARQITFEKDPDVALGVPVWSPDGAEITFVTVPRDWSTGTYWVVKPDGSNLRRIVSDASWAAWSADSRWIYCEVANGTPVKSRIMKIPIQGGAPQAVREHDGWAPAVAPDGAGLYYVKTERNANGLLDYQVRVARPETGPSNLLALISGSRVPHWQGLHPVISHNGKWLVLPLNDEFGSSPPKMARCAASPTLPRSAHSSPAAYPGLLTIATFLRP